MHGVDEVARRECSLPLLVRPVEHKHGREGLGLNLGPRRRQHRYQDLHFALEVGQEQRVWYTLHHVVVVRRLWSKVGGRLAFVLGSVATRWWCLVGTIDRLWHYQPTMTHDSRLTCMILFTSG